MKTLIMQFSPVPNILLSTLFSVSKLCVQSSHIGRKKDSGPVSIVSGIYSALNSCMNTILFLAYSNIVTLFYKCIGHLYIMMWSAFW